MKYFEIIWMPSSKYASKIERHSKIQVNPKTDMPSQEALNVFMATNGNLKKNKIISIQEYTDNTYSEPIGEPIKETDKEVTWEDIKNDMTVKA